MQSAADQIECSDQGESRLYPNPGQPVLIYLPGVHGDATLFTSFRMQARKTLQVLEFVFPRTTAWSINDYAAFVRTELSRHKIRSGWLLAESYSSQVAWSIIQQSNVAFQPEGLVLAGGFVRYPLPAVAFATSRFMGIIPPWLWKFVFSLYGRYARFRHRHAPDTRAAIDEFIRRRTGQDLAAMAHRIKLIAHNDPSQIARQVTCPVYLLAGAIDPIVPTWPVLSWLRRECPAFAGHRIIWPADHNVLGTEPAKSLAQILEWMNTSRGATPGQAKNFQR